MSKINDYPSLLQAIADFTHRADLTQGTSPYADYFIEAAQTSIENDIPDLNFGNCIRLQEVSYGPFAITNGVVPVPPDWIAPKFFTVGDGIGDTFTLIVKQPAWLYDNYPLRAAQGIPAYIARDIVAVTLQPQFDCSLGQTVFQLPQVPPGPLLVTVDGVALSPTIDYSISGDFLTLTAGVLSGEVLAAVTYLPFTSSQNIIATGGQTSFALAAKPIVLTLSGVVLQLGVDYTITSVSTVVLSNAALAGQILTGYSGTTMPIQNYTCQSGQTTFGVASNANIGLVTLNGVTLYEGTDYTSDGSSVTLLAGTLSGQTLSIYYNATASISAFVFGPYPDSDYTIQGTYYGQAAVLSSTVATNWMVLSVPTLLHAACMIEAGKFLKDTTMQQLWGTIYQQRLKALVDRDKAERVSPGTLQVETA